MVKGVAIKFDSYEETIPKLLKAIKFDEELKKHEKVVLKPNLIKGDGETATRTEFIEQVLKFCMENRNPGTEIIIAEGCDGVDTFDTFDKFGYKELSEKYGIGLVDLNEADTEEIEDHRFLGFKSIKYPKVLLDSFVVSLPTLRENENTGISASLDNMVGAFPARHYKGFFSLSKNKLKDVPLSQQIHDIVTCRMPNIAIIDASDIGLIIAGKPFDMDKQAARALGMDWVTINHLNMVHDSMTEGQEEKEE